ncbi:hypothetical protein D3C85_1290880 [compost metagenome]
MRAHFPTKSTLPFDLIVRISPSRNAKVEISFSSNEAYFNSSVFTVPEPMLGMRNTAIPLGSKEHFLDVPYLGLSITDPSFTISGLIDSLDIPPSNAFFNTACL